MAQAEKYRVVRKIDAGGMAEVYEAVAEGLQGFEKRVAIKRVLPHLAQNEKFIAMFLDEARLSLHLSHANIVQVFDIGRAGGTFFIVMEYIDGTNLKSLMTKLATRNITLPVEQAIYIIMEVCKGLSYAHGLRDKKGRRLGIVHRDVSPPNILLSRQGEVKIADFGLAKATSQLETTDPGVVKGKYAYLCPEAVSGQEVDHRMDIFGCGIVLFEMITGKRLFLGRNDVETINNVRAARVPDMRQFNPQVTPQLQQIVQKALARDPAHRYQSCDQLADALANYLFSAQLKVTGFDIKRTLERVEDPHKNKDAQSIIDKFIQEELSVFASLDTSGASWTRWASGAHQVSSASVPAAASVVSGASPNLEAMLEGAPPRPMSHSVSAAAAASPNVNESEVDDEEDVRQTFFVGLTVAVAVVTVITAVVVWALGWLD